MNNDAYAAAFAELEEGRVDKGAWARAFAESGGDESKAKALYIKARAESRDDSPTWRDTLPPIEDVQQKRVAPETNSGKAIPAGKSTEHYEAALGHKNSDYYIRKFHAFDEKGPGLHASWSWAAFFFTGFWALYRKMYGWFFAWWAVATVVSIFSKVPNAQIQQGLGVVVLALWVSFSVFANSLYHRKIKAHIAGAQKSVADASQVNRRLSSNAGVSTWVAYIFGAIPVLGIVMAVALPAYQDYTQGRSETAMPVKAPAQNETPGPYGAGGKVITSVPQIDHNKQSMQEDGVGGNQNLSDVTSWGQRLLASRILDASSFRTGEGFAILWQQQVVLKLNHSPEHALYLGYKIVAHQYDLYKQLCKPDMNREGGILDLGDGRFETFPVCISVQ